MLPHTTVGCSCQILSTALLLTDFEHCSALTGHDFLGLLAWLTQGELSAAEQQQ
jgi:hypothetical protein